MVVHMQPLEIGGQKRELGSSPEVNYFFFGAAFGASFFAGFFAGKV